ncbi:MAG: hypothetical protein AB1540_04550 [Bdellovibrionota bacterium]
MVLPSKTSGNQIVIICRAAKPEHFIFLREEFKLRTDITILIVKEAVTAFNEALRFEKSILVLNFEDEYEYSLFEFFLRNWSEENWAKYRSPTLLVSNFFDGQPSYQKVKAMMKFNHKYLNSFNKTSILQFALGHVGSFSNQLVKTKPAAASPPPDGGTVHFRGRTFKLPKVEKLPIDLPESSSLTKQEREHLAMCMCEGIKETQTLSDGVILAARYCLKMWGIRLAVIYPNTAAQSSESAQDDLYRYLVDAENPSVSTKVRSTQDVLPRKGTGALSSTAKNILLPDITSQIPIYYVWEKSSEYCILIWVEGSSAGMSIRLEFILVLVQAIKKIRQRYTQRKEKAA